MIRLREAGILLLPVGFLLIAAVPSRAMDQARVETRVDDAVATFGATGRGVIIAILDRGIDWQNNDFRNPDGSTRIAWIYDLTDDSGKNAPGNSYGYGTIYSQQQIDNALTYGTNLPTRDALGHGTTTAGIACGNGHNLWKYRGVAYEATIIAIKYVAENVPAHGTQPAETAFYDANRLPAAVQFVSDKAHALGMPFVMLLNLGSVGGPMEGTSPAARLINTNFGPGIQGRVFVTGSSDDGNMANHAAGSVSQGGNAVLQIYKGDAGYLTCDLWYPATDALSVSVQTPTGLFGPYAPPASNNGYDVQSQPDFLYYHYGANVTPYGAEPKREIWISLSGSTGNYALTLHGTTVLNGHFDASLNPSRFWDTSASSNYFTSYVVPGYTVWDDASASNNICPNDYVHRTNWVDIDGIARSVGGQGNIGNLWLGSGIGPTWDGRTGIDVSAPGDSVFTTYNTNSWWATFRFNLIQDGNGRYGRASAVSAANPIVTGIIALMLQINPQLDAAQVKQILQQSARADTFTGAVPNARWGYGKVDAYNALTLVRQTLPLLSVAVSNAQAVITIQHATVNGNYSLQRSTDLFSWAPLSTNTAPAGTFTMTDTNAPTGAHFYRVAKLP